MPKIQSPLDIISFFKDYKLSSNSQKYLKFHALRYFILWQRVLDVAANFNSPLVESEADKILHCVQDDNSVVHDSKKEIRDDSLKPSEKILRFAQSDISPTQIDTLLTKTNNLKILDIGPGFFTELLGQYFSEFEIHSLGLNSGYFEFKSKVIFHPFDLNQLFLNPESEAQMLSKLPKFDMICFCEVLEHLYTGPEKTLEFLSKTLKPNGVIFIQTPNGVSLRHRILMLMGRNPYPLLRPSPNEPGHYREYTLNELNEFLKKADLKLKKASFHNYFNYSGSIKNKIYKFVTRFFPASFRDGVMIEVSKND